MVVELQTALLIVAGTLALFTFYFEGDTSEYLTILGVALVLTECAILGAASFGSFSAPRLRLRLSGTAFSRSVSSLSSPKSSTSPISKARSQ